MQPKIKIITAFLIISMFSCNLFGQELKGKFTIASRKKLKPQDIENLTYKELYYMRNEIFARHGYKFQTAGASSYFKKQDWFEPSKTNVEKYLTEIEKYNINLLKDRQDKLQNFQRKDELVIFSDSSSFKLKATRMGSSIENTSFYIKTFIDQDIEKKFIVKKHEKQFTHDQIDITDIKTNIELFKIGPLRAEKAYNISKNGEIELLQGDGIVFSNKIWYPELTNDVIKLYSITNQETPFLISNYPNYRKMIRMENGKILWVSFYSHEDQEWIDYFTKQNFMKVGENESDYIGTFIVSDENNIIQMIDFFMESFVCCAENSLLIETSKGNVTLNFHLIHESISFQCKENNIKILDTNIERIQFQERLKIE